jgi:transposase, IS30 family
MKRLDQEERYQIYAMKRAGFSQKTIADELMRSPSTICREIKRNTGERGYRPKQAHEKAIARALNKPKSRKLSSSLLFKINQKLEDDWSPEQIFGYYQNQGEKMLSHESIYQYIWRDKAEGGLLYKHLRRSGKSKKVYGKRDLRGHIKNRVSIDERPPEVNEKKEFGHWEIDLMVGSHHKGFLVTAVERKTKHTLVGFSQKKDADSVKKELISMFKPIKECVKTITADNGKEFAGHEDVARVIEAGYYFAHPYRSCERGLNENTNGLIRQYYPKGKDLRGVTKNELKKIMSRLNNRPRKTLDYKLPKILFKLERSKIALVA